MNDKQNMRLSADKVIEHQYLKKFTPEQLAELKTELSTVMIEHSAIEDEFDGIKQTYKAKLKPLKVQVKEKLQYIRDKARLVKEECYINYEGEYAVIYDVDGSEIERRPKTADERQTTIFSINRDKVVNE